MFFCVFYSTLLGSVQRFPIKKMREDTDDKSKLLPLGLHKLYPIFQEFASVLPMLLF